MLIIFAVFILIGLCVFGVVFIKEFKSGAFDADDGDSANDGATLKRSFDSGVHLRDVKHISSDQTGRTLSAEPISGGILGERCQKLEQLLEEKSRTLLQMEKDLENERSHRSEFESLKEVFQRQIEDLKAQNRKLKENASKAFPENSGAVSDLTALNKPAAISPAPAEKFDQFFNGNKAENSSLSLHDVFESRNNKS
ncbi:MAG: hypothetical protein HQL22_07025 [Candidatus Omnitrophica bacterium]|nr:hypothetical protein [Candidatus Omnitrophota bacterium]